LRQGGVFLVLSVAATRTLPYDRSHAGVRNGGQASLNEGPRIKSRIALLLLLSVTRGADAAFEREPVFDSAELISPSLLSGPGWSVAPQARVVGYQARFVLRTDHGEIEAESVEMLAVRIAELPAVEALHSTAASEVFARSVADAGGDKGRAVARIARDPIKTIARLPAGVARYFSERLKKIGARAQKLGDRIDRRLSQDGDPYDDVDAAMAAGRGSRDDPRAWYDKPRRELTNLAKGEFNYGRSRRAWAQRLGIDPQTTNPLIRPRLDALSWIAVAGDRSVDLGVGMIGGAAVSVLDNSSKVHDAVWKLDPIELRARNRARISRWCRDEPLLRRFLQHKAFNAQLQTALVEAVRELAPTSGCEALLETALMAATEQEARFVVNALRLIQHHLGPAARGGRLQPLGATLAFRSADDELLLPLAVDHLSWTAQMEAFFDGSVSTVTPRTVLVTGTISLPAQQELTARGWSLVPNLPYPDAPPYALSPAAPSPVDSRDAVGARPERLH
jgi:hypothetical protein